MFPHIKIKGIIDLGGVPIRFYKLLNQTISSVIDKDFNCMI